MDNFRRRERSLYEFIDACRAVHGREPTLIEQARFVDAVWGPLGGPSVRQGDAPKPPVIRRPPPRGANGDGGGGL